MMVIMNAMPDFVERKEDEDGVVMGLGKGVGAVAAVDDDEMVAGRGEIDTMDVLRVVGGGD